MSTAQFAATADALHVCVEAVENCDPIPGGPELDGLRRMVWDAIGLLSILDIIDGEQEWRGVVHPALKAHWEELEARRIDAL